MQVTPLNSISPELASSPLGTQSSVQRTVDPQDEAQFAQLASVSPQEPMAASSTKGTTKSSAGDDHTHTMEDVFKTMTESILFKIMFQGAEDRAKIEKVTRGEDPE
jgi:hypothetical protein